MNINDLPPEILVEVFAYLSVQERYQYERVCRFWQKYIFHGIKCLAFEQLHEDVVPRHLHFRNAQNQLPDFYTSFAQPFTSIVSKCGQQLRSFKGSLQYKLFPIFAEWCNSLRCIDVEFLMSGTETLSDFVKSYLMKPGTFADSIGKQLTCATLFFDWTTTGLKDFIENCPNLVYLSIRMHTNCYDFKLVDIPQSLSSFTMLESLVLEDCLPGTGIDAIGRLSKLRHLTIVVRNDNHNVDALKSLMRSCSSLTSLSLTAIDYETLPLENLPENVQHLTLIVINPPEFLYENGEYYEIDAYTEFYDCRIDLKVLNFYQRKVSDFHLAILVQSIDLGLPMLEELSIFRFEDFNEDLANRDHIFEPLLSLMNLQKLALDSYFNLSDAFITRLLTDLENLTTFGEPYINTKSYNEYYVECTFPDGPNSWYTLKALATSHPSTVYHVIGMPTKTIYVHEPLPSNLSLVFQSQVHIHLGNGYGMSQQWHKLLKESPHLTDLTVELDDLTFSVSALPKSLEKLSIIWFNRMESDALNFDIYRSRHLRELKVSLKYMSNQQLGTMLASLPTCFPFLNSLTLFRDNVVDEPIDDDFVSSLQQCSWLTYLYCNNNFAFLDGFQDRQRTANQSFCLHTLDS